MLKLGMRLQSFISGNICFKFLVQCKVFQNMMKQSVEESFLFSSVGVQGLDNNPVGTLTQVPQVSVPRTNLQ
jgi:hypothetical protein